MASCFWRLIDMLSWPIRTLFYAPQQLFATGKRLGGLSLSARLALLVAVFLIVCVGVSLGSFWYTTGKPFPQGKFGAYYLVGITMLIVVVPLVVCGVVRRWQEGGVSPFADIQEAWAAGLAELERQGLNLSQTPLFLILGSAGEAQEKALFDGARLSLNLREFPVGPSALHWYANPDGIYLVCTAVGCLGRVAAMAKTGPEKEPAASSPARNTPDIRGTIITAPDVPLENSSIMEMQDSSLYPNTGDSPSTAGDGLDIYGTMMVSGQSGIVKGLRGETTPPPGAKGMGLSRDEGIEQERRLEYLCQMVRRARQPLCPINGILTLLPFKLIQGGARSAMGVQQAATRDMSIIAGVFKLRCAVNAVVVGMEEEPGFRELVRRIGRDRAMMQRFGKGFSTTNPPIPERLGPLCAHACGSFEDFVYMLFRERGSLSKPGNTKLYSLLCKIRHQVQERLENILVSAYGSDPDKDPNAEPMFFSGCYFAAMGETEDRQAFVKGVLDKLPQEQGELQWTTEALRKDQFRQRSAQLIFAFDFFLLASAVGMFIVKVILR
jgi:hypothetical protein